MPVAKRVLVTGGAGFLGSHLCDHLLRRGIETICLDDLSTGSLDNVRHWLGDPRFTFVRGDVAEAFDAEVDRIYNLACPASPAQYRAAPIRTLRTSVLGALNMLTLARRGRTRILQASTSEVYGDPVQHPQSETYWGNVNPLGERACYDEGKRCAETLFADHRRQYAMPVKIARIFNTYGPRMRAEDGRVVSSFIAQALAGQDITIFGDGSQTRSFCYVDDMIDGLVRLMETPDDVTGPVNLGNPQECSIGDLARMVIALTGSRSRLVRRPLPEDDPRRRRPDITLARELLAWQPTVPLETGLRRTIAAFEAALPAPVAP
ncbi:UDP-glucuronic acid decarboxylase family protein [Labrys wisconsinensis]|uniref:UDP-glucuronic acid decarboxylase family protein n=1 Tax=Labrys wisconsinensis TaxID=425677 RepID=UPI0027D825BA|nr:UDP-glucuronic acid decarboxylase family protein [Labrys wisconsinensis]